MPLATSLDRWLGYFSPAWQLKRMRYRAATEIAAQYYEGGDISRRTQEWKRPAGDANAVTGVTLGRLRDAARNLVRNNGYAESGIGTIQDDVVGWGIAPTAKNAAWKEWSSSTQVDADGRSDLAGLQQLVIRTVVEAGECLIRRRFVSLREGLAIPMQIQVLEPDFIDSSKHIQGADGSKIVRGVEFDPRGRRVAYWLFPEHPGSTNISTTIRFGTSERVPASDILHVFKVARPGQVRGASWFAPILIRFHDFDEYADASLVKQKIAACLAVITSDVDGGATRLGEADPNNSAYDILEPGIIANIAPGRSIDVVNPPSVAEYSDFVKTTLQEIASGLGVTPEDLTGDYSQMNFSSARLSRLRHWSRVQGWRWRMLVPQFLNPLWAWSMDALELAGGTTSTNDDWTAPPLPMIEPDKEGLAIVRNIRGGITTPSEALRERGFDPDVFWSEYRKDFLDLDDRGIVLDSDARKMTQAGQAQFVSPHLSAPPDGPPEEEDSSSGSSSSSSSSGNGNGREPEGAAPEIYLSVADAGRRYGLNPHTIRLWVRKGAIPHVRIGPAGAIRVRERDMVQTGRSPIA